jgi:hypothetical protein
MSYQDARPLATFPRKEREILKQFQPSENGTDCTFEKLPKHAQEVALELMATAKCGNELVRMLDSDLDFRYEIGCEDMDIYPPEVDAVMRYYRYREDSYA